MFINVLCSVIQEKLQLPVKVCLQYLITNIRDHDAIQLNAQDDGHALLKACLNNEWRKAKALIESGCYLEARSEVYMHACVYIMHVNVT